MSNEEVILTEIRNLREDVTYLREKSDRKEERCIAHDGRLAKCEGEIVRINDIVAPLREKFLAIVLTAIGSAAIGGGAVAVASALSHPGVPK